MRSRELLIIFLIKILRVPVSGTNRPLETFQNSKITLTHQNVCQTVPGFIWDSPISGATSAKLSTPLLEKKTEPGERSQTYLNYNSLVWNSSCAIANFALSHAEAFAFLSLFHSSCLSRLLQLFLLPGAGRHLIHQKDR